MAQPRLKPGDTFVYTQEMNEAKKRTYFNDNAAILIGQNVQVDKIVNDNSNEARYEIWEGNTCYYMLIEVVDPFLPEEPSNPRTLDDVKEGDELEELTFKDREIVIGRSGGAVMTSPKSTSTVVNVRSLDYIKKNYKLADQPAERWKPGDGDKYYYVDVDGFVDFSTFDSGVGFKHRTIEIGNCFETAEEAEKAASEVKEFWRNRGKK